MKLLPDWKAILTRAWSVRLFALSFALQALDVVLETRGAFAADPDVRITLQLAGLACAAAGLWARFLWQDGLSKKPGAGNGQ